MKHAGLTGCKPQHRVLRARPDFAFPDLRVAVFVDGCFWHGCPEHYVAPTTNAAFWKRKIQRNRANDRSQTARLREAGWVVLRFWECRVKADGDALASLVLDVVTERCRMLA